MQMMDRTLFYPLALLLSVGIFSTTVCWEQATTQKRNKQHD